MFLVLSYNYSLHTKLIKRGNLLTYIYLLFINIPSQKSPLQARSSLIPTPIFARANVAGNPSNIEPQHPVMSGSLSRRELACFFFLSQWAWHLGIRNPHSHADLGRHQLESRDCQIQKPFLASCIVLCISSLLNRYEKFSVKNTLSQLWWVHEKLHIGNNFLLHMYTF